MISYLTLVEDLLGHLMLQHLGDLRLLEDLILTITEDTFDEIVGERETDDQLLPGEERPVEEPRETLSVGECHVSRCSPWMLEKGELAERT